MKKQQAQKQQPVVFRGDVVLAGAKIKIDKLRQQLREAVAHVRKQERAKARYHRDYDREVYGERA